MRGVLYLYACLHVAIVIIFILQPDYGCLYRIKDFGQAVVAKSIEEEMFISKADVLFHTLTTYFSEGKRNPYVKVHLINTTEILVVLCCPTKETYMKCTRAQNTCTNLAIQGQKNRVTPKCPRRCRCRCTHRLAPGQSRVTP